MAPAPDALVPLDERLASSLLPEREPRGHKGTFGRVVVVAGSFDYAGAALLSGTAALRAGSGLVTLALPASLRPYVLGRVPELITRALPEMAAGEIDGAAAVAVVQSLPHDALVLGPGLQAGRGSSRLVRALLDTPGGPACVDAGALEVLSGSPGWSEHVARRCVLTPHPGELHRLGIDPGDDDDGRLAAALEAATTWRQVVVLKGAGSVVAHPDGRARRAPFELPLLGSGGTGDVLAGIIGSLLGQGLEPYDAASLGAFLHGRAGEHVGEQLGDAGLLASDLLPEIPRVRRHLVHLRARDAGPRLGFETA